MHRTWKVSSTQCTDLRSIVTVQDIMPPRCKKNEHTLDNLRGKRSTIVPVLFTATAYRSWMLCGSVTHSSTSPAALYVQSSLECNNLFRTPPCMLDLSHAVEFLSCSNNVTLLPTRQNFIAHPYNYEIFLTKFFLWNIFNSNIFQFTVDCLVCYQSMDTLAMKL